jgi:putative tryptophan/tyrosine transport system substrate-binding protein
LRGVEPAARSMGLQIQVLNASAIREIDAAFATLVRERPDALFVAPDPFLIDRRVQLALLAVLHRIPAIYQDRLNAEAGGLASYGPNLGDAYRHIGVYTGRILKGAKPADLPVVQSSKFELVINASTARMLGLTVPDKLLAAADEVIHRSAWRRGCVAARGARSAAGNAGNWVHQRRVGCWLRAGSGRLPQRPH